MAWTFASVSFCQRNSQCKSHWSAWHCCFGHKVNILKNIIEFYEASLREKYLKKCVIVSFPQTLQSYLSYAIIDYFWWRLNIRFLPGLQFVSVWPVLYISTKIRVLTYFRVFFYERTAWDTQPVSLLSKSDCYTISLLLCFHDTQGFSSSHSYGAAMDTFLAPLFPYCIFTTIYFSGRLVWVLWCVFLILLFRLHLRPSEKELPDFISMLICIYSVPHLSQRKCSLFLKQLSYFSVCFSEESMSLIPPV